MSIFRPGVGQLLLNMINSSDFSERSNISRDEFISFVQKAGLVPEEKADEFINEMLQKYPIAEPDLRGEPIDPISEGIVPADWDDD